MQKKKKIFIGVAIVFFAVLGYISYDISSRTTFPGSKGNLKERIMEKDTVKVESDTTYQND